MKYDPSARVARHRHIGSDGPQQNPVRVLNDLKLMRNAS